MSAKPVQVVTEPHAEPTKIATMSYSDGRTMTHVPALPELFFSVMLLGGTHRNYFTPEVYAREQERYGGLPAKVFMERQNVIDFQTARDAKLSEILGFDAGTEAMSRMRFL